MKTAIIFGEQANEFGKMQIASQTEDDLFGINESSIKFSEEAFVDNVATLTKIQNHQAENSQNISGQFPKRLIVCQPFLDGATLHVSDYYASIKYNPNEDVDKMVELTDGEIRYHLLQAFQKNIKFYFPSYHSSLSLLLFYLVWNDYKKIELYGCEIKPASQEDKVKADYATNHIDRLITFIKELGIEITTIKNKHEETTV